MVLVVILATLATVVCGLICRCLASRFKVLDIELDLGLRGLKFHIHMERR